MSLAVCVFLLCTYCSWDNQICINDSSEDSLWNCPYPVLPGWACCGNWTELSCAVISDTCLLTCLYLPAHLASPSTSGIRSLLLVELAGVARLGGETHLVLGVSRERTGFVFIHESSLLPGLHWCYLFVILLYKGSLSCRVSDLLLVPLGWEKGIWESSSHFCCVVLYFWPCIVCFHYKCDTVSPSLSVNIWLISL